MCFNVTANAPFILIFPFITKTRVYLFIIIKFQAPLERRKTIRRQAHQKYKPKMGTVIRSPLIIPSQRTGIALN